MLHLSLREVETLCLIENEDDINSVSIIENYVDELCNILTFEINDVVFERVYCDLDLVASLVSSDNGCQCDYHKKALITFIKNYVKHNMISLKRMYCVDWICNKVIGWNDMRRNKILQNMEQQYINRYDIDKSKWLFI